MKEPVDLEENNEAVIEPEVRPAEVPLFNRGPSILSEAFAFDDEELEAFQAFEKL